MRTVETLDVVAVGNGCCAFGNPAAVGGKSLEVWESREQEESLEFEHILDSDPFATHVAPLLRLLSGDFRVQTPCDGCSVGKETKASLSEAG